MENRLLDEKIVLGWQTKICKERDKIGGVSFADFCSAFSLHILRG